MTWHVRWVTETTADEDYKGWDYACGTAVRVAIEGATRVVLTDDDGVRYNIYVSPVEENS